MEGLLDLGAVPDCKDKKGLQPLHFAAGRGRTEVVKFLWSKGAELDTEAPGRWGWAQSGAGQSPFHTSVGGSVGGPAPSAA